jgi:hypothetical protein
MESEDAAKIQQSANDLLRAMQEIGTAAYQQPPGSGGNVGGTKPRGDDVVDGEFKEA